MLDLMPTEDEAMIADAARDFLTGELPIERLRPNASPVDDASVYRRMAELGWLGLGLPADVGGSGMGLLEEVIIQRECARHLASPFVLAAVLAGHLAMAAGDMPLARAIAAGAVDASIALPTTSDRATTCDAFVFDWKPEALILAWNGDGMGLFEPKGFIDHRLDRCLDNSVTMSAGRIDFGASRHWITEQEKALRTHAQVLLAAALTGIAERACELTVEYVKVREQFGKPIGSFQAVKHRCADMAIRARLAWHQSRLAARALQAGQIDAAFQAASAKLVAGKAAQENARAAIQLHGGIGYQAECDVHWFMKRAQIYDQLGGSAPEQARRISRDLAGMQQLRGIDR